MMLRMSYLKVMLNTHAKNRKQNHCPNVMEQQFYNTLRTYLVIGNIIKDIKDTHARRITAHIVLTKNSIETYTTKIFLTKLLLKHI